MEEGDITPNNSSQQQLKTHHNSDDIDIIYTGLGLPQPLSRFMPKKKEKKKKQNNKDHKKWVESPNWEQKPTFLARLALTKLGNV